MNSFSGNRGWGQSPPYLGQSRSSNRLENQGIQTLPELARQQWNEMCLSLEESTLSGAVWGKMDQWAANIQIIKWLNFPEIKGVTVGNSPSWLLFLASSEYSRGTETQLIFKHFFKNDKRLVYQVRSLLTFCFPHPGKLWRDQEGAGSLRRCQGGAFLATATAGLRDSIQVKSIQTRRRQGAWTHEMTSLRPGLQAMSSHCKAPGHSGIPYTAPSAFTAQYHVPTSQHI